MTFTTDPPIIGDIDLIPGQDEKADLNAPAGSGGKLVTGQIPNISISSTSVVADAAERLALDVQEGDVAIQTNVSQSFIFTGGDNVAPNWQVLDFDAVGAISGEDISPNNITALGQLSGQSLSVTGAINGADTSAAGAGEALTSDGTGGLGFTSIGGGGALSDFTVSDLAESPAGTNMLIKNSSALNDIINNGDFADITQSETAMFEVGLNPDVCQTLQNNSTAVNILNNATSTASQSIAPSYVDIIDNFQEPVFMFLSRAKAIKRFDGSGSAIKYKNLSGQVEEFTSNDGTIEIFPNEFVTDFQMKSQLGANSTTFDSSGNYDFVPVNSDRIVI